MKLPYNIMHAYILQVGEEVLRQFDNHMKFVFAAFKQTEKRLNEYEHAKLRTQVCTGRQVQQQGVRTMETNIQYLGQVRGRELSSCEILFDGKLQKNLMILFFSQGFKQCITGENETRIFWNEYSFKGFKTTANVQAVLLLIQYLGNPC